jgi:hypothetical protein
MIEDSDSTVLVPGNFEAIPPRKATNKGYYSYNQHHASSKLVCCLVACTRHLNLHQSGIFSQIVDIAFEVIKFVCRRKYPKIPWMR